MKILHVINTLTPAGAEILLAAIAPAMKRRGFDVEIATIYSYENRTLHNNLCGQGVKIHSLDFKVRYDPRILTAIQRLTKATRYDIVHAHLFPAFYWTALSAPPCKKLMVTEHSIYNTRRSSPVFRGVERLIYRKYDSVFCISNSVKEALSGWLPEYAEKFRTVYNGIDIDKFASAAAPSGKSLDIPESVPLAAMVSRIDKAKDHMTILRAVAMVPDLHFLLIGDGEALPMLRDCAKDLGIHDRVHFLGYRGDVPQLLKLCTLYIHSANWEGFGLAVVEAMAAGVPVIASNIGGLNEVVQDGISGLLFTKGDANDLADKTRMLLDDDALREKLRDNGLHRAHDFSLANTVNTFLSCYSR
jgi:glycosyltransferase involved in cell wall biosynthesis